MGADKRLSVVKLRLLIYLMQVCEGRTSALPRDGRAVLCSDFLLPAVLRTLAITSLPSRADGLVARI